MLGRHLVALAFLLAPAEARAGGRYAQWGMTPDEVIAASGGEARPFSDKKKHDPRLERGALLPSGSPTTQTLASGELVFP